MGLVVDIMGIAPCQCLSNSITTKVKEKVTFTRLFE